MQVHLSLERIGLSWEGGGEFNSFKIDNFKFESLTTEINEGTY